MSTDNAVRTAVVFVHGLLERRPMDTFDDFAKTLLAPHEGGWEYYPRPVEITDSYEARRYMAPSTGSRTLRVRLVVSDDEHAIRGIHARAGTAVPASASPRARPGVRHLARGVVGAARAVGRAAGLLVVGGYFLHTGIAGWIIGLVTSVVVLSVALAVFRMAPRALTRSFLTTGFVNVARYFDLMAPESHAARRAIRGGLVDLLYTLHQGRYARIVVVGHGIGGYIAYDALTTLWEEMHELRAAPDATPRWSSDRWAASSRPPTDWP